MQLAANSTNRSIGLIDAGWSVSASWAVPSTAVSGGYIAHLVRTDRTAGENHIPFVVRDDGIAHDIVFQTSDTTWHAYNGWGGYNLYGGGAASSSDGRAYKVSDSRPFATRDGEGTYAGPRTSFSGRKLRLSTGWRPTATMCATWPESMSIAWTQPAKASS